jgi:C-terminal processing protease CtpA/Prc
VGFSPDGKGTPTNLTLSGVNDDGAKWILGGKAMLWFSNRDGLRSVAPSGSAQRDVYAMFFTKEARDRFRLTKEEYALVKEAEEKKDKEKPKTDAEKEKKDVSKDTKVDDIVIDFDGLDIRPVYAKYLSHISNNYEFSEMLSEMLGELNISHSGSSYSSSSPTDDATAALGVFYDQAYAGAGVKVAEVVKDRPLNKAGMDVKPGMIIESIDGQAITPGMNDGAYRTTFEEALGTYALRKGLVVDTRFNGGGDLVADLAMFLSGKQFLSYTTDTRGNGFEPNFRWTWPSISLANEANDSDGYCYAYMYKMLTLGPLVGMPVPGTYTFAGWEMLQDGLRWGVPGIGVKDSTTGK